MEAHKDDDTNNLPTPQEILDAMRTSPDALEDVKKDIDEEKARKRKKDILVWWYNSVLASQASSYWTKRIMNEHTFMDDTMLHGKKRKFLTVTVEAFTLLILTNSGKRWQAQWEKHQEDSSYKFPRSYKADPDAYKLYCKSKWSDPNAGQQAYEDWGSEANEFFVNYQDQLMELRKNDEQNDLAFAKYIQALMRETNEWKEDTTKTSSKKRKRTTTNNSGDEDDDDAPPAPALRILDE